MKPQHYFVCTATERSTDYHEAVCECIQEAIEAGLICEHCHTDCWVDIPCHRAQLELLGMGPIRGRA